MFNTRLFQLVTLGILAGCASQPAKNNAVNVNPASTDLQCLVQPTTGSMIGHNVCTTKAQRDAQQADVDALKNAAQQSGGGCRSGACGQPQ
jgi:uncharacterized lipoprotein YajG